MLLLKSELIPLRSEADIVSVRQIVRKWAIAQSFNLIDQTKIVTATSELARNTVIHAGGGTVKIEALEEGPRKCVRLTFEDQGPGIPDIELALRDGYTTGRGLGLGLGGSKRLCNEFEIQSEVGKGTRITVARWHSVRTA